MASETISTRRRGGRPPSGDGTDWLSTAEAARRLAVTTRTLYRFIDRGELPAFRFGRVIRIRDDDLAAFIDSCRVTPGDLGTTSR